MDKAPEAFRTISEVAEALQTPAHVLRFWESKFTQVRPVKRAGGRRYYRPADMDLLYGIRSLLHDQGMTIRGVQKMLQEHGVGHVAAIGRGTQPDGAIHGTSSDVSARRSVGDTPTAARNGATGPDVMATQGTADSADRPSNAGSGAGVTHPHARPTQPSAATAGTPSDAGPEAAPETDGEAPGETPQDRTAPVGAASRQTEPTQTGPSPTDAKLTERAQDPRGSDAVPTDTDADMPDAGHDLVAPEGPPLADNIVDLRRPAPARGDNPQGPGVSGAPTGPTAARPAPSVQARPETPDAVGGEGDEATPDDPAAAMIADAAHDLAVRLRTLQPQDLAPVRPRVVALAVRLDRHVELMAARSGVARP